MKTLQILTAAAILAASASANAWWGPFDWDDNDYYSDNRHKGYGRSNGDGYGDGYGDGDVDGDFDSSFSFNMNASARGRGHGRGHGRGYNDYRGNYYGDYYGNKHNGYGPYGYAPVTPVAATAAEVPVTETK